MIWCVRLSLMEIMIFVPQEITRVKKEQIIKQFNNMNEKV